MEEMSLNVIAQAIGVDYRGHERMIADISSDSRNIPAGCVFVALEGDQFDGHTYVAEALDKGAAFAIVMRDMEDPGGRIFRVEDTRQALLDIAGAYRRERDVKVVAVTGSVGKTTTKEMVACVVSAGYETLKTQMNLNNEIGLSQTVLQLTNRHRASVLEMGMDGPGQIAPLSRCASPDVGVITNVGVSHMETLGSQKNIMREKLDIRAGMKDGTTLVLSADDDMLRDVRDDRLNLIFYATESKQADIRAEKIKSFSTHTTFELLYDGKGYDAQIPTMGRHNVQNALAAFAVGIALGLNPARVILALRNYKPAGMRQNIVPHAGFTVVEDCYNAAPDSMRAALEALRDIRANGRKVLVLADMLELGGVELQAHYDVGMLAANCDVDLLLCTGPLACEYVKGALAGGMNSSVVNHFKTRDDLFEFLHGVIREEDIIWVKGSRGMHLERLLERIYREC